MISNDFLQKILNDSKKKLVFNNLHMKLFK